MTPGPPPLPSVSSTSNAKERQLIGVRGEGGGREAESYDREKAWSSTNHSILFEINVAFLTIFAKPGSLQYKPFNTS